MRLFWEKRVRRDFDYDAIAIPAHKYLIRVVESTQLDASILLLQTLVLGLNVKQLTKFEQFYRYFDEIIYISSKYMLSKQVQPKQIKQLGRSKTLQDFATTSIYFLFFILFIYFIFATNTRKYMSAKTGNDMKTGKNISIIHSVNRGNVCEASVTSWVNVGSILT